MAQTETPTLGELRQECKIRLLDLAKPPKFQDEIYNHEINRQLDLWTQKTSMLQVTYMSDIIAGVNPTIITPLPGYQMGEVLELSVRQNGKTILNLEIRSPAQMYREFVDWPDTNTDSGTPMFAIFDFDPTTSAILRNSLWLWPGPSVSWTKAGSIASGTITIGGTANTGDVIALQIGGNTTTYTVLAGATTSTVATGVAAALNAVSEFATEYSATASGAVVTVSALVVGSDFNVTIAASVSGAGATTTATISGATLTGGSNTGGGLVVTCKASTDGLLVNDEDALPLLARLGKEPIIEGACAELLARTGDVLSAYHEGLMRRESSRIRRAAGLERQAPRHTRTYNT